MNYIAEQTHINTYIPMIMLKMLTIGAIPQAVGKKVIKSVRKTVG